MAEDDAKARGNAAFSSGDFPSAVIHYTSAISLSPTNHILFSNRSAAHASLRNYPDALSDAERTVALKPDWPKGYSRLGFALVGLKRFQEAILAYTKGLKIDPSNDALRSGLACAQRKQGAKAENKLGNDAFKKREFEAAVQHFSKSMEMDDEDISYVTNRAAVYLQIEKYKECIEDCDKAVEKGREVGSDNDKMSVAKALTRKGTAFVKMAKCSKDYEPAIEAYKRALTLDNAAETLKKMREAERAKQECERVEYIDPEIGDEERAKGDVLFEEKKYPDAIKQYTEAIKRNPKDPKAYSNRAACYNKLGAFPNGLEDAEKCIELDPKFSGGYIRKAEVEFYLKEFETAMKTCLEGLKHDSKNQELLAGVRSCTQEINTANRNRGGLTSEELKKKRDKAMEDPEIQSILTDPVIRQVMSDLEENPSAAQKQMKNTVIQSKIKKLVTAGIVHQMN